MSKNFLNEIAEELMGSNRLENASDIQYLKLDEILEKIFLLRMLQRRENIFILSIVRLLLVVLCLVKVRSLTEDTVQRKCL
jgi:hypothetical protein